MLWLLLTTRRGFLAGAAALGAAAGSGFLGSFTSAAAQSAATPPRGGEYVIRGGYIITMDRTAGISPPATSMSAMAQSSPSRPR